MSPTAIFFLAVLVPALVGAIATYGYYTSTRFQCPVTDAINGFHMTYYDRAEYEALPPGNACSEVPGTDPVGHGLSVGVPLFVIMMLGAIGLGVLGQWQPPRGGGPPTTPPSL